MEKIKSASKISKKKAVTIPKGAKILSQEVDIRIKEIENGYIVSKTIDTKFQIKDRIDYDYTTKEYYSKEDPLEIKIKDESLADSFK